MIQAEFASPNCRTLQYVLRPASAKAEDSSLCGYQCDVTTRGRAEQLVLRGSEN